MIEQRVFDARQRLTELQNRRNTLNAKRRAASFQVMRSSNAIVWEKAKQRYRHWVDENGMRIVLLAGGLFSALVLPFAFVAALFNSLVGGVVAGVTSVVIAFGAYVLILCGNDSSTSERIEQQQVAKAVAQEKVETARMEITRVNGDIASALHLLSQLEPELARQRAIEEETRRRNAFENLSKLLFDERWRELRGVDFENYVARVFQHLGYETEETPTSGDQGVDLVVISGSKRIAIQIKGYYHSVSNSAVQEVVAGMKLYRCSQSCVVTNSRFTKSALDLATANHCLCIEEGNFEDFIYGRVFSRVEKIKVPGVNSVRNGSLDSRHP